ncbi:MAG TPA: DNA polymerase III subunit beta [Chitinophagales bacterium]|jgi:DNA polymerase-3 subunit beta|nr:DNA polymerase III subunit beta [Chitinophagales bacterium]MBP6154561.1 DNA polymerase III subunit beta [Chitinophagales bacterium]HQV77774.1 DNA polymerase III subunit beta [Chitinophagales bacterium]HQW78248.1 DNA polymerase III subunit beta [Chitinophagales bacterium]HRB18989.1 DNA polymerase III subunit beta [Chitinophagales bacterium]
MRFVVSSSQLLKNLQKISGVISTNTVLPILEDFLFDIDNDKLNITATDLDTTMSVSMEVDSKESFKIAIPARILLDSLKALPEQPITIAVDDTTNSIEITTDNGKYKLSGENSADFPKEPIADEVENVRLASSILNTGINKTLFAVSNDELRPAMTGVLFQLDENGITFVATDAHKLVKFNRNDISGATASFIVPKKALNLLKSIVPNNESEVLVQFNKSNAFFSFDNIQLICRLIDAKYPDYNAVIPKENPNLLTVQKDDFFSSLKRTSIFSNKTTHQVVLKMSGSELTVSAQDLDFSNEASEKLSCEYLGNAMEIGFNAKFLLEMLSSLDSTDINIELSTPNRAGIIRPSIKEENEDLLMLVMPVMLNN